MRSHYGMPAAALLWLALASPAQADVYRRGEPGEPATLDPQQSQTVIEADIDYDLFEGLLTYDSDGRLAPGVATGWTVSEDGLTYDLWVMSLTRAINLGCPP